MSKTEEKQIHAILNDSNYAILNGIKEKKGFKKNTDAIRWLINTLHNYYLQGKYLSLDEKLEKAINAFLSYSYLRRTFFVSNTSEIANQAISGIFDSWRSNRNLHNQNFRRRMLTDREKMIAEAIVNNQFETSNGLSISDIERIAKLEINEIRRVIEKFVERGWLVETRLKDNSYYHAPVP